MSPSTLRLGVLQITSRPGAVHENLRQIETFLEKNANKADLWVAPELCLSGYPARDAWSLKQILRHEAAALETCSKLSQKFRIGLCLGHISPAVHEGPRSLYNAVSIWDSGNKLGTFFKQKLPNYDIFDEARFFSEGPRTPRPRVLFRGQHLGIHICEESWDEIQTFGKGHTGNYGFVPEFDGPIDLLINVSASPWTQGKNSSRKNLLQNLFQKFKAPILYVNTVGVHDDIILDGQSLFLNSQGQMQWAPAFQSGAYEVASFASDTVKSLAPHEELRQALVFGIKDFFAQSKVNQAVLGISGGLDSAIVASLACEALGAQNVFGFVLCSEHTSQLSIDLSQELANNLGFPLQVLKITDVVKAYQNMGGIPAQGLPAENLQSRIRGTYLMSQANTLKAFLLATGNKSELAMGYSTLYGDLAGALCPIGDLWKTEVYSLAHFDSKIPKGIISRPPTAELAPNQKDSDSLPEYDKLDAFLELYLEGEIDCSQLEVWKRFFAPTHDPEKIIRTLHTQEFKRFQAPPILKTHVRSFGSGWRFPLSLRGFLNE